MILQGTMQDGTVIPVQVDQQGRLVAEGLPGPKGDPGMTGPAGGSFALPVGQAEGKVLAWSSGGLAWVDPVEGAVPRVPCLAGTGYIPSTLGDPFFIDILPANAKLVQTGVATGWQTIVDGNSATFVARTFNTADNQWTRFRFDLRHFYSAEFTRVIGLATNLQNNQYLRGRLLGPTRNELVAERAIHNSATGVQVFSFPATKGVRFLEVTTNMPTVSSTSEAFRIYGITVDGGWFSLPGMATTASGATPV